MAKRYANRMEGLDAILNGTIDTRNVRTAAQIKADKEREKRKREEEERRRRYTQIEDVLSGDARNQERIRKLQAVIDNHASSPQEKESARKSIQRIRSKGV